MINLAAIIPSIPLEIELGPWLLEQSPVVVVMGVMVYWLAKRLGQAEKEKDELSKEVIKISTLWEAKADKMSEDDKATKQQILALLTEIKASLPNKK